MRWILPLLALAASAQAQTATDKLVGAALKYGFSVAQNSDPQYSQPFEVWIAQQLLTVNNANRRANFTAILSAYRTRRQTDSSRADTTATAAKNGAAGDVSDINDLLGALP